MINDITHTCMRLAALSKTCGQQHEASCSQAPSRKDFGGSLTVRLRMRCHDADVRSPDRGKHYSILYEALPSAIIPCLSWHRQPLWQFAQSCACRMHPFRSAWWQQYTAKSVDSFIHFTRIPQRKRS